MSQTTTTIELDQDQIESLRALSERSGHSVQVLIRDAVDDYLLRQAERDRAFERFFKTADRIQSRIPPGITPEEIEADITAAREEVRAMRRAQSGR